MRFVDSSDRSLLVVFGDDAAQIYYEGGDDPTPASPAKRRKARGSSAA